MKLNKKGFAITGILYTLFIIFTLTLISIISGLNSRKKIMEKSVETLSDKYKFLNCTQVDSPMETTPSIGKYIFKSNDDNRVCYTYLPKNTQLDKEDIVFTTAECNNNKSSLNLKDYCT